MFYKIPFTEKYVISKNGQVKSLLTGKIMKYQKHRQGYVKVKLHLEGGRLFYVHRLIAQTFIPNPNNLPSVNHKNGVGSDNRICNLEWVSHKQNVRHAYATGLTKIRRGEQMSNSKLKDIEVIQIKKFIKTRSKKYAEIAALYGVSRACIADIAIGRSWDHL